ncbi:MAG: cupin domain-containing protein [Bdellovibrionia bacterium]
MQNSFQKSSNLISKSLNHPDESRQFTAHGHLDLINFEDGTTIGKGIFEPGWRWSTDVKPLAQTTQCMAAHMGYCISGKMIIRMENGEEYPINEGDAFNIPPGHDAWVVGTEPCVMLDWSGYKDYAKKAAA